MNLSTIVNKSLSHRFPRVLLLICSVFLLTLHLTVGDSLAAQANLSWTAPTTYTDGTPLTSLAGYKVYMGTSSGNYTQNIDVGNTTSYTLGSLSDGTTYYFAVTAYDASGDVSGYSNQASLTTSAASSTLYTLTGSAGSGGSISPSGAVVVSQGASQTFAITPASGYKVAGVTVDGSSAGAVSSYTFSNVAANHTIAASFAVNAYTISASAGTGGSISPSGTTTVNSGASQTCSITPAAGYQVAAVTVDGVSVGAVSSYTFSNVAASHTIAAIFASSTSTSTSLTSSAVWQNQSFASQNGVFTAGFDMVPNAAGIDAVTMLSAVAAQAYTDGAAIVRFNTTGTIDARNGGAYAAAVTVPYTAGSTYHVRMVVNVPQHVYDVYVTPPGGSEIKLAAGYAFRTEQATVSVLNNLAVYANPGSHTVLNFALAPQASYSISASAGTGGSISPAGTTTVASGSTQTYTITPAAGYQVSAVTVDGASVGAVSTYTFSNVAANHTISAIFVSNVVTYTISASAGAGGSITPAGTTTVNSGSSQIFTITPASGYQIAGVTVDGASVGAVSTYTFSNVAANHTISASFASNVVTYTISASAGAGGSITPAGTTTVNSGSSQTFAITPASGYQIADVTVDGVSVGAVSSYTISGVSANHTINATFAPTTTGFTITASAGTGGKISPAGTVSVTGGANKTFTIQPSKRYTILDVKVDGVSVGAVSSYSFSNITANHTIQASFQHQ